MKFLLNYYINPNLSIIFCLFSGDIYLSFGISVSLSTVSEIFRGDLFAILLAILLPINGQLLLLLFELLFLEQF